MKFRKKPVVIEAFVWTGGPDQLEDPIWIIDEIKKGSVTFDQGAMFIKTLEGTMAALVGDYIIKGIKGEIYPCKPDIFEASYEKVEEAVFEQTTNNGNPAPVPMEPPTKICPYCSAQGTVWSLSERKSLQCPVCEGSGKLRVA